MSGTSQSQRSIGEMERQLRDGGGDASVLSERASLIRARMRDRTVRERILHALATGSATPTELAARTGAAKETISRARELLEREELIVVSADQFDGRVKRWALTEAGRAVTGQLTDDSAAPVSPDGAVVQRAFGSVALAVIPPAVEVTSEQGRAIEAHLLELISSFREQRRFDEYLDAVYRLSDYLHVRSAPATEIVGCVRSLVDQVPVDDPRHAIGHVVVSMALGRVFARDGRFSEAFKAIASAVPTALTGEPSLWQGRAALVVADVYRGAWELRTAVDSATRAIAAFEKIDDLIGRAEALAMRGFCQRLWHRYSAAQPDLDLASSLVGDMGGHVGWSIAYNRAELARLDGRRGEADKLSRRALDLGESLRHRSLTGWSHLLRGTVLFDMGEPAVAIDRLDRAAELLHDKPIALATAQFRRGLCRVALKEDSSDALEEALLLFNGVSPLGALQVIAECRRRGIPRFMDDQLLQRALSAATEAVAFSDTYHDSDLMAYWHKVVDELLHGVVDRSSIEPPLAAEPPQLALVS